MTKANKPFTAKPYGKALKEKVVYEITEKEARNLIDVWEGHTMRINRDCVSGVKCPLNLFFKKVRRSLK